MIRRPVSNRVSSSNGMPSQVNRMLGWSVVRVLLLNDSDGPEPSTEEGNSPVRLGA